MDQPLFPQSDLYRRRERFLELVARARLAPPTQHADLLRDAATVAQLHRELTGTPLLPHVNRYLDVAPTGHPAP